MTTHSVTFADNRIGRRRDVEVFNFDTVDEFTFAQQLDDAAEAIYRYAVKFLGSRDVEVYVGSTSGEVMVGGFRRVAVFEIEPALEQVSA